MQGKMTVAANKIDETGVTEECGGMDIRLLIQRLPMQLSET